MQFGEFETRGKSVLGLEGLLRLGSLVSALKACLGFEGLLKL